MRTMIPVLAGLITLAAVSTNAAPLPPGKPPAAELSATPPIEMVRDGCGPGWHRHHWRDYWGREDKPAREVWREGLDPGA